jgi:hypothetical protein
MSVVQRLSSSVCQQQWQVTDWCQVKGIPSCHVTMKPIYSESDSATKREKRGTFLECIQFHKERSAGFEMTAAWTLQKMCYWNCETGGRDSYVFFFFSKDNERNSRRSKATTLLKELITFKYNEHVFLIYSSKQFQPHTVIFKPMI